MAFSEVCRICLCVNVSMCVLKKTGVRNLYKTLTNSFMDEDEEPIIVCFTCHARLVRCSRLQQQAIESNAVLEQLLAGEFMSIPKPHKARDEIQFTPVYHIDIRPVECDTENDCKDEIFSLESVKVEEENFEYENSKFEVKENHETETAEKQEYLEIDAFEDRHTDLEDELPLNAFGSKSKNNDDDIEPSVKIESNSTDSNINVVHKENVRCHKTQKNSNTTAVRTQVEQTPVQEQTEIFDCDICEFKTSQKRYILAHLKAHVAKRKYCCNNCEYKCTKKSDLQRHMKIHIGEKPFSCNICEYICIRKSELQSHMKIHTGEKPFSCNICEFKCRRNNHLQRHVKIHTGEKPFLCNICEFKFSRKDKLQTHMKIHTGEKPYSCNICGYKCIKKDKLQTHMQIHTGEKPYSCNICELRCIRKTDLKRHMKIHTGKKPFSCNICDSRFNRKGELQRHMKIHTVEKYKNIKKTLLFYTFFCFRSRLHFFKISPRSHNQILI